jgi:hypothetical protein
MRQERAGLAGIGAQAPIAGAIDSPARPGAGSDCLIDGTPLTADGQTLTTGIFPIFARHSAGPDLCTALPSLSTATVTGMSLTSSS